MTTPENIRLAPASPNNSVASALKANDGLTSVGEENGCDGESESESETEREMTKKKQKIETVSPVSNVPLSEEMGDATATEENQQQQKQQPPSPLLPQNNDNNNNPPAQPSRKKRKLCERCHRPVPQTCLCEFLPATPITVHTAEVVVLQHPLELKNHKAASHRSLPLLELCLDPSSLTLTTGRRFGTESLGTEICSKLWGETAASSYLPVLVFPRIAVAELEDSATKHAEVGNSNNEGTNQPQSERNQPPKWYREDESTILSLGGLLELWKRDTTKLLEDEDQSCNQQSTKPTSPDDDDVDGKTKEKKHKKILLLVLDATWKHAREMHLANIRAQQYPPHMLRLALEPEDFARGGGFVPGRFRLRGKASKTGYKQQQQQQQQQQQSQTHRKKKRTKKGQHEEIEEPQIGETWMSTAECIAWILSNLEGSSSSNAEDPNEEGEGKKEGSKEFSFESSPSLYEILMKPLDAMVAKWNSYRNNNDNNSNNASLSSSTGRKRDRPESESTAIRKNQKVP
jgi:DTW domain-containing protein YfiP